MAASGLQVSLPAPAWKGIACSTNRCYCIQHTQRHCASRCDSLQGWGTGLCSIFSTGVGQHESDSCFSSVAVPARLVCMLQAVVNQAAAGENAALRAEVQRLRAENAQLLDRQGAHLEGRPSFGSEVVTPATSRRPQVTPLVL